MAWRRWILVLALLPALEGRLAAGSAEQDAFEAAAKAFNDTFYDWAEGRFAQFAQKYPASTNLPKAILLQAEARFALTNYAGAIELLIAHQSQAGEWGDQYLFWLGQAQFNNNNFQTAA